MQEMNVCAILAANYNYIIKVKQSIAKTLIQKNKTHTNH